ncbi:Spy/CpxP family protein refolding chaperone [Shewanella fidelis]|uniref:Spy/CpxP family protein refolding chaperone n=1 Tax=Shewanella fidelis TaxID=173509 RepID=A0AAW8NVP4_9GAMM|nr:Spy/CpxP family protein refolding chaperone [Shewanella fidelis]MDR8525543.1 Spy/CpxP family protein refolding chaperone [Shewanella fidelis]MDW4813138.1 Spy/CpxP family protein refolding chaperone [Shewanella fidelis]MDW4816982.1 Spy/CpxP family protein refolding chaperone [Shewanella fidelis]MDW4820141.1 Spy/CpxP family protein refolding chaperone [Shewanella fidelis]MDW4825603.1 Spy/CpxP family protein refolding chaperone [Shewanella fidelis]
MKKNTLKAGLLAVVASTALLTAGVHAGDDNYGSRDGKQGYHHMKGKHGGHHDLRKMFRGLDLTDEQKTEMKALFTAYRDEMKQNRPSKEERAAQKAQMLEFITTTNFSEDAVRQALAAKQEARQQKAVDMLKLQNQAYQLLTPEQQEKFQKRFAKHHKR